MLSVLNFHIESLRFNNILATSVSIVREEFIETVLQFLWGQWDQLGVYGVIEDNSARLIDPEALLLFTLDIGRYDPRLFDEVLDWLSKNSDWMNVRRIRALLKEYPDFPKPVLAAVCELVQGFGKPGKWRLLTDALDGERNETSKPMFYFKDGRALPIGRKKNELFLKYGLSRAVLELRGMSGEVPIREASNLIFKLRSWFGVTSRAEIFAYLLTHDEAYPSQVARDTFNSQKGIQDAMVELGKSGDVQIRNVGREKRYRLRNRDQWWKLLGYGKKHKPIWICWPYLFNALIRIWRTISEADFENKSVITKSFKLKSLMTDARSYLDKSGYLFDLTDARAYPGESYIESFETDIRKLLVWLKRG